MALLAPTTPRDIIMMALKDSGVIGVGQDASADDIQDSFRRMNWLIAQWARKRWLVYRLDDLSAVTNGKQYLTIGPGGDIPMNQRPDRIERAYFRQYPNSAATQHPTITFTDDTSGAAYFGIPFNGTLTVTGGASVVVSLLVAGAWVSQTAPLTVTAGQAIKVTFATAPVMTLTLAQFGIVHAGAGQEIGSTPFVVPANGGVMVPTLGTSVAADFCADGVNWISLPSTATQVPLGAGQQFRTSNPLSVWTFFPYELQESLPAIAGTTSVDYPLDLLESREDFSRVVMKGLQQAWPQYVFYDPEYPLGTLYVAPVAAAGQYEVHVLVKKVLEQFTDLSQPVNLPPEYEAALYYNLTTRTIAAYKLPPDPQMAGWADDSLNVLRGSNTAIARLGMPTSLRGRQIFNIYSGY